MQALLVNQSPVSSITYSNKMRVIYDGVEQDAELRKYPSGKIYFRTENAHFVPVNEVGVLIPLTKGKNAIVDFEDYEYLVQWKWRLSTKGYAVAVIGKRGIDKAKMLYMHRVVTNAPKTMHVDHIWGDKLDNRKKSLRFCTNAQNISNSGIRKNNTSGYKGVIWDKRDKKWRSTIGFNRKSIFLGCFSCKHEAASAYNVAAVKYFGEFAKPNKIPNGG